MELLSDVLFALGQIAALGFAAYGGWLAFRHSHGFLPEGEGRFEHRHVRHARQTPRKLAGQA
jgi:hypothetical protein